MSQDISDDFADGDFLNNPSWLGDTENFIVNDQFELQLMDDEGGVSFLNLPVLTSDSTQWEFLVRQEFAPSSSNFSQIILLTDQQDIESGFNGYYLKIGGESGDTDALELYRQDGGDDLLIWRGNDGDLGDDPSGGRFRVTHNDAGTWKIEGDFSGGSDFVELGVAEDNTYTSGLLFGFRCTYTSTRADKFFLDDVRVGPIFQDEEPPSILGLEAINSNQLEIQFNELLDETIALNTANYNVDLGIGSPNLAEFGADQSIVTLTFDDSFVSGADYVLTATSLQDQNGNISEELTASFTFIDPSPGTFKEVIFNEIFPDPTPSVGLPPAEYLEIYNPTELYFQLEGWKYVNSDVEHDLPEYILSPGHYLILCDIDDIQLFENFGPALGLSSFAALTNSGDSLTLMNSEGVLIDWVMYTDDWYNDPDKEDGGYSLELINPFSPCTGSQNWSVSLDDLGGSPGIENSIFDDTPDTEAPSVEDYMVLSTNQLVLEFSEPMDEESLINGTYNWDNGITTQSVQPIENGTAVLLQLSPDLGTGIEYELMVENLTDCSGNQLPESSIQILLGEFPEFGELVISEIMADPTPEQELPDAEYFELVNIGKRALEISGLRINDVELTGSEILFPGQYLICIDKEYVEFYQEGYVVENLGSTYFTNSGREVLLFNQFGDLLDRVDYKDTWYNDPEKEDGGFSLERMNLTEICRGENNWRASTDPSGGTPSKVNSVFTEEADKAAPLAIAVRVVNDQLLEIVFNEPIDSLSLGEINIEFSPELGEFELNNVPPNYTSIEVALTQAVQASTIYSMSISGYADCSGNVQEEVISFDFGLPQLGNPGDILINEVLFNPRTGGSDFVEIVNISNKVISISNWELQNQNGSSEVITIDAISMLPQQYLLLTKDAANIASEYPISVIENFLEMENTPSYNNDEGTVILVNQEQEVIDSFDYDESQHFELLNSVKGVSLERLSFTRPTNDNGNWLSAAENVGFATPGYLNSQYNPEGVSGSFFELENEVFSPDNDGFQDVLLINYKLDKSGAVATIKVFDRRGREIRELSNNEFLGTEGTITWDGISDQGTKASIGPHLIYIEVFTADGFTEIEKLPCIVAGKLSD